ncbi:hypothetical protein WICPIJ_000364 [Wickerhamomyces pijperi]|uniref:Uncharacterized protein n=1 Tax=Wickerhamomyces pijperi TaxID=599730 RepID=A0A9P8QD02_WICPI|nr:hypothetical protein WICPIJ_000364 [Wickerhamomyces pijperi]
MLALDPAERAGEAPLPFGGGILLFSKGEEFPSFLDLLVAEAVVTVLGVLPLEVDVSLDLFVSIFLFSLSNNINCSW